MYDTKMMNCHLHDYHISDTSDPLSEARQCYDLQHISLTRGAVLPLTSSPNTIYFTETNSNLPYPALLGMRTKALIERPLL